MKELPPLMFEIKDQSDSDEFFEVYGTGVISGQPWVVIVYKESLFRWMAGKPEALWYLSENDKAFLEHGYAPSCLELLYGSMETIDKGKSLGCNTLDIEAKNYGKQVQDWQHN